MDESTDNLITEHLKGLRSEVQTLRGEMHSEFRDVKHRLASVETTIVAAKHESADIRGDYVRQQVSLDNLAERIQRLESAPRPTITSSAPRGGMSKVAEPHLLKRRLELT